MIIDKLENVKKYKTIIPESVINFLLKLTPNTDVGHYDIEDKIYANVDIYSPKPYGNCHFEAHKKYIDVQMLLSGEEKLEYGMAGGLEILEKYDESRDITFYNDSVMNSDIVHLTPYKFAFIFPHEAHKPQIKTKTGLVKKVVVKIPV